MPTLEEAYNTSKEWIRMSTGIKGVFVRKLPKNKKGTDQGVIVEIRPVDEQGKIMRGSSHIYAKTYEQFVQMADLIAELRKSKTFQESMGKVQAFNAKIVPQQESKPVSELPVIQL